MGVSSASRFPPHEEAKPLAGEGGLLQVGSVCCVNAQLGERGVYSSCSRMLHGTKVAVDKASRCDEWADMQAASCA